MAKAGEYAAVQEYLFSLKAGGVKFGLDRMRALVAELGHPERAVPVIHVAGTNGKGSTAAMIEAIFRQAGWTTGLYTSPHLIRLGERVQVNRGSLTEAEIIAFVDELRPLAERIARRDPDDRPSFFEFMTAMAFLQFARRQCDIAIVEVGMGGRLDATNVVDPEVAVITSIGLDHCEELGDTLEKIAAEKAGIVKPGRPVVLGRMPTVAEQVIRQIAAERGAPVVAGRDVFGPAVRQSGSQAVRTAGPPDGPTALLAFPPTSLPGDYQRWNAATASLVARQMPARWKLDGPTIALGLMAVSWPGRWQRIATGERTVIVDASHNPEGAAVLDANLTALRNELGRRPILIVGALGAARGKAILEVAARHAAEIILVVPDQPRASPFELLESLMPPGTRTRRDTVAGLFPSPGSCTAGEHADTIVVTGSIYLAGEVLHRMQPAGDSEPRLQDF